MKPWVYIVIGIVAFIVLVTVFYFINRSFRRKYGFGLYGGGILMLVAAGGIVGGAILLKGSEVNKILCFALIGVGVLAFIITLIYDIRKCGGAAFLAILLQILFCVPSLILIFDIFLNKGRNSVGNAGDVGRMDRERRADRRYYDDRRGRDDRW